ncbi:glycosyltransferase family 2 protein [Epilithonimonas xixisoli]|uniref:Glycosyl transferase family 2 n=1 Tax=Epilithonimonas xixisoli TaxID=1476462 RepID=A0A4R8I7T5_9FLAO|nr:glycosyltransferase family 2 protein [Epilithonimonas xixisoli]TDX84729.1 hypothetical protein B0I22_2361 [Epilithonimonas xixisoli]
MEVDIIIKSFNRAFYLDKVLFSIGKFVTGFKNIIILDDGTPEILLSKITEKYPFVEIRKSTNHQEKSDKILRNQEIDGYKIPSELWINTVKNATENVLVIEDDVWFTDFIDLEKISKEMTANNVHLTKIGWQSDVRFWNNLEENQISENLISQNSTKLFTSNRWVMDLVLHNRYKFFSLLCRLRLANNQSINEYYNFGSILMGLYRKDFWIYTWQDSAGRVNEKDLLKNSTAWYHRFKKNKSAICRTTKEYLKTTYISSATNSYHRYNINFNVLAFNNDLNQRWLNGEMDVIENFPNDYSRTYLSHFLNDDKKALFYQWSDVFIKKFGKDPSLQ